VKEEMNDGHLLQGAFLVDILSGSVPIFRNEKIGTDPFNDVGCLVLPLIIRL